jgi:ubiquinone/menaquinone biosynthesis C-methylase UbiE
MTNNKEQWPESYLNSWKAFSSDERSSKYLQTLFNHHISAIDNLKVADVMSANGKNGKVFREAILKQGGSVTLSYIDASSEILSSISLGDDENIIHADVTHMPEILSDSFDVVLCRYGFNNLAKEQWNLALNEVLRILKPGGIFLLQDHFVPGSVFSELVNEAEQFLANLENKQNIPYIYSTEDFNALLDSHPLVKSRIKAGYGFFVNIWDRLKAKKEILPDFKIAKEQILNFYKKVCLDKYKLLIVDPEEYIHIYNITYAIVKKG